MPDLRNVVSQAAARLNMRLGRDSVWRGHCPCCSYSKQTLALFVRGAGIAVSCAACGNSRGIAAVAGIPLELVVSLERDPAKIGRAIQIWRWAAPAAGTPVEQYLRGRGITEQIPPSIRYRSGQRNWSDGRSYPAMVSLVERVPEENGACGEHLHPSGVHITFLSSPDANGGVRKAAAEANKLALGQLRQGGVWLSSIYEVRQELVIAEGIETALSAQQLTGLPTVSALSAAGMKSFRWPSTVRRIWIAADSDATGLQAAMHLRARALRAGVQARIRIPADGYNDFNDLIKGH